MKTAVVLTLAILAQAAGDILLSREMKALSSAELVGSSHQFSLIHHVAGNPTIWLGTTLLTLFFLLYAAALSWADLSLVLPATSFGYVLNVACGHYFLSESVSLPRWVGTGIICLGVIVVSRPGRRSEATSSRAKLSAFSHQPAVHGDNNGSPVRVSTGQNES